MNVNRTPVEYIVLTTLHLKEAGECLLRGSTFYFDGYFFRKTAKGPPVLVRHLAHMIRRGLARPVPAVRSSNPPSAGGDSVRENRQFSATVVVQDVEEGLWSLLENP